MRRIRCAIYTRKSSEEGLEQDFNSLHAQREACEAYVASQKHEGWELVPDHYDDGGISGGHLDRPALHRLMRAVDDKQIDQIVVYKIDRLTRSLGDFANLVERLDQAEASFVSVTQSFDTSTSMGRLTLNVLLSFAQFEREVTAERIRDKIAASKKKGLWMGGNEPLGYQADGRSLKICEDEARVVRGIFHLYLERKTVRETAEAAESLGFRSKRRERDDGRVSGGNCMDRGHIYYILTNPIYAGRIRHRDRVHEGQHPAIVDPRLWDTVQEMLRDGAVRSRGQQPKAFKSPLAGKLFDETGDRLTPSHSQKNGKRLRYYVSKRLVTDRSEKHPSAWRLPAEPIERLLAQAVQQHLANSDALPNFTRALDAAEFKRASDRITEFSSRAEYLGLIKRAELEQGSVRISMCPTATANFIGCKKDQIDAGGLVMEVPFQMRRRGVELKLYFGRQPSELDKTLVKNTVNARRWLKMLIEGSSYSQIAEAEGTNERRIQSLIDLAMLSPEILDTIASGTQPIGLTTEYLSRNKISPVWAEQVCQIQML
ncbi:MAG: recombinase family protein [Rhodospirillaceae bacterium]|jgi:site-specific DNA recombinase|nr:recombinase family protein [Rhodospirillaceae bacterium]